VNWDISTDPKYLSGKEKMMDKQSYFYFIDNYLPARTKTIFY